MVWSFLSPGGVAPWSSQVPQETKIVGYLVRKVLLSYDELCVFAA
jgi:hypothetical protein